MQDLNWKWRVNERGQGLVETGLVMALIAIFAVATIWVMADFIGERYVDRAANQTQNTDQFYARVQALTGDTHLNTSSVLTTPLSTSATTAGPSTAATTSSFTTTLTTSSLTTSATTSATTAATTSATTSATTAATTSATTSATTAATTIATTIATTSVTSPPPNTAPSVSFASGTPAANDNVGGAADIYLAISDLQDGDSVNTSAYIPQVVFTLIGTDAGLATMGILTINPWRQRVTFPSGNHDLGIRVKVTDFHGASTTIERAFK